MSKANLLNVIGFHDYSPQDRVQEHCVKDYPEEASLGNTARVAAMERRYFSTSFRREVGIPFADWTRRLRILEAIELLKKPDHSIDEIAVKVGFSSLGSFKSAFRWHTKTTPEEFRKSISPEGLKPER